MNSTIVPSFSVEEELVLKTVCDFTTRWISPIAQDIDERAAWPQETLGKMAELGLFGSAIPMEYGGVFKSHRLYYRIIRELAKGCASHALTLLSHSFCSKMISDHGTRQQKESLLPKLASGELLGSIAMTEADAGSDLSMVKSKVENSEQGYILDGAKQFITNGGKSDIIVVLATTASNQKLFDKSLFIVKKPLPGLLSGKGEHKMGFRAADNCELSFDQVQIPKDSLLGKKGQGTLLLMKALESSRLAMSCLALGIAESSQKEAIQYAKKRRQFGQPIKDFQSIQNYLAENEIDIECAHLMTEQAALLHDGGKSINAYSAMTKYFCTEAAKRVVDRSLQIHGAYGYIKDFPVERHYRDIRLCTIIEGTSEIQRTIIAKNL